MAPPKVWAKGVSSSEMNVSWEPVQQDMNGILLGYEVSAGRDWEGRRAWGRAQGRLAAPRPSSQKLRCTQRARHMQPLQHGVRSLSSALWPVPVDSLDVTAWWEPGGGDPGRAWPAPFVPEPSSPGMLRAAESSTAPHHPVPEDVPWPSGF